MVLRLLTSVCLTALIGMQLACSACGGSQAHPGEPGVAESAAHLVSAACDACGDGASCNSLGTCTPAAWHCGPMYFNAGPMDGCDCDCGVPDPDCDLPGVQHWCYGAGRPRQVQECSACQSEADTAT